MIETIISKKYKLIQKLEIGQFFQVFKASHINNLTFVVIKVEKKAVTQSKLFYQARVIKQVQGQDPLVDCGLPKLIETASQGLYNYMIMEPFGISVAQQFSLLNRISLKQSTQIGLKIIERIELLHSKGYIHRDIRLQNFLYGFGKNSNKIYISGLNNCKKYLRVDKRHVMYRDNKLNFTGTAKFVSINTQLGIQQSRRDDIEAFVHMLIYMIKGTLPWLKLKTGNRKEKYQKILYTKITTPIQILCLNLPIQFSQLLRQCRTMQYEQAPDYQFIRQKLKAVHKQEAKIEIE